MTANSLLNALDMSYVTYSRNHAQYIYIYIYFWLQQTCFQVIQCPLWRNIHMYDRYDYCFRANSHGAKNFPGLINVIIIE